MASMNILVSAIVFLSGEFLSSHDIGPMSYIGPLWDALVLRTGTVSERLGFGRTFVLGLSSQSLTPFD